MYVVRNSKHIFLYLIRIRVEWWTLLNTIICVNFNKKQAVSSQLNAYRLPNKDSVPCGYQNNAVTFIPQISVL